MLWIAGRIAPPNPIDKQRHKINRRITALQRQLVPLEKHWVQGEFATDKKFAKKKEDIEEEILDLQKQLIRLNMNA